MELGFHRAWLMANMGRSALESLPRWVSAAAGIWWIAMPAVLGYTGTPAAVSDRIVGPLVVCLSVVAMWPVTRGASAASLPPAAWAIVAPVLLDGYPSAATAACIGCGIVVCVASMIGSPMPERFGGGWRALWAPTHEDLLLRRHAPDDGAAARAEGPPP